MDLFGQIGGFIGGLLPPHTILSKALKGDVQGALVSTGNWAAGGFQMGPAPAAPPAPPAVVDAPAPPEDNDNTMIYVAIGAAVVVAVGALVLTRKG